MWWQAWGIPSMIRKRNSQKIYSLTLTDREARALLQLMYGDARNSVTLVHVRRRLEKTMQLIEPAP